MCTIGLVGAPVQSGASQPGCLMGPDAFRTAGIAETLQELGHRSLDLGNIDPRPVCVKPSQNANVRELEETVSWAVALEDAAFRAAGSVDVPIFLGGDHSLSIGSVPGVARYSNQQERPQYVLWLDAHPDIHTLETTNSGHLHGTPVAYFTGRPGFENAYPAPSTIVPEDQVCMMGIRSVDPVEKLALLESDIHVFDMRSLDENGVAEPLRAFLTTVQSKGGALHVSLDVDFLEPGIAPAVGTTVPGGATFREAHLIMEMLHDSGLVTSLDLVELNPFLDERGRTARLMVDLCASLFGRTVLDRPTTQF
jgi:arginase